MSKQAKNKKIALIGYKLAHGGLERVWSTVSEMLHDSQCEISVIVLENEVLYPYSGTLINLGHFSKFQKYFQLRKILKDNDFDLIIDFRHRINPAMELVFLHYIYSGFKTVYTIHSSKLEVYLTSKKWVSKQILKRVSQVVTVSKGLKEKLSREYNFNKSIVIPNTISVQSSEKATDFTPLNYKYCIAVGRLVELKQFDQLIKIYAYSELPNQNIHLVILGEGNQRKNLEALVSELNIKEFVHLLGFKNNRFDYIKNAEFLALTSQYEGFSMVILEALYLETPVIAFDCPTGPSELIQHQKNGLLIENQHFELFKQAMNTMISDQELYNLCKQNSKPSTEKFSSAIIQKKWLDLVQNNTL